MTEKSEGQGRVKGEDEDQMEKGTLLSKSAYICVPHCEWSAKTVFELIKKSITKYILYFCLLFEAISLCSAG